MTPSFDLLQTPLPPGVTLLEASAGTGKTYALAAIYLRLVGEEGLLAGQIAVTTYTIPATEELRTRIRERLTEAVAAFDGEKAATPFVAKLVEKHAGDRTVRDRLADAARDFDEACIFTIHGFCQRILKERAFETGAAPDFELVPDQSALVQEIAEDFWRQHFSAPEPGGTPLALLAELTPDNLAKLYQRTAAQSTAALVPDGSAFLQTQAAAEALLRRLSEQWPAWRDSVRRLFVEEATWAIGEWKKVELTKPQLALVERLAGDARASVPCYEALEHFCPSYIARKKGLSKKTPLPAHAFTAWCEEFAAAREQFAAEARARFLAWARTELAQRKAARGVLGFEDLLTQLHAALCGRGGADLARAVQARFAAALVDEFQDTDPIQETIFRRLFAEAPNHRLFLIGDPKQAIYAFRGADLFAYQKARQSTGRQFALDTNYRSDAALVQSVNHLFQRARSAFVQNVDFEPTKAARPSDERALRVDGEVRAPMRFAFWDENSITVKSAEQTLPAVTAKAIGRLLTRATLKGRRLNPRDVAVLCWKNAQCQSVQAALAERGIPAVVLNSTSVLASDEAREMRVLLAALVRPAYEPAMRAALATSWFGLDAAALEAVTNDTLAWESLLAHFSAAHARWRDRGFIQMFREFLRDTHARERLLAQPAGERRLTNFMHLAELLHEAAREFSLGPAALERWLATEMAAETAGEDLELRLESDDDAVKVLTIHKSKGLEWPVVFCPFLWSKSTPHQQPHTFYHDASRQPVLDLGSANAAAARAAAAEERLAEQLRLLYVALTRARHECHVTWGHFNSSEDSALMWLLESPPSVSASAPEALVAHAEGLDAAHLRSTLETIASEKPECFFVENLSSEPGPALAPAMEPAPAAPVLAARVFTGSINRLWRVSSFSSLTAHKEEEHDLDAEDRPRVAPGDLRGIHAFPRGARTGVCLHEIFEKLDFTDDRALEPLVSSRLSVHNLWTPEQHQAVVECTRKTLAAPLGSGPLRDVPRKRTLRELEFHLPAALLTSGELAAATAAGLKFEPQRGILRGFIDLIFERDGRFHIVDWKSNWLGATEEAYTPAAIAAEMAHHRYGLQWRLYLLALHRYLAVRQPGYDPARHLGDVFYLFIRGLTPGRPELGIFQAAPDPAGIAKLETFFPK